MSSHKSNLDLRANQLQNAVLHVLASAPANPVEGQMYYDSTKKKALIWNTSAWVEWGGSASGNYDPLGTAEAEATAHVQDHEHAYWHSLVRQDIQYFTISVANPVSRTGTLIARLFQNMVVLRVDAHIKSGTSVTFNIQERSSVNVATTGIKNSTMTATTSGVSVTTFDDDQLAADNWLYLEIGDVTGTVGVLTLTLTCSIR